MQQVLTKFTFVLDVIEDVVSQGPDQHTTLVICSSREDFLSQLQQTIQSWRPAEQKETAEETLPTQDSGGDEEDQEPIEVAAHDTPETKHPLLTPTLYLLATSQQVRLAFCPSINTLRAFIATFRPTHIRSRTEPLTRLIILDLLALHHGTSEFTLQGLSRTFATVASTAYRTGSHVQLVECKDVNDPDDSSRGSALWNAEVPLLSDSVKIGSAGASWAGRSIVVKRVAGRWFEFDEKDHSENKS